LCPELCERMSKLGPVRGQSAASDLQLSLLLSSLVRLS
jgi:hypothetical protein